MGFSNGELSAADVAAVTGNGGFGNNWGNDGSFWIIILFLFAMMSGWNNGNWGNNGGGYMPYVVGSDVQTGFNQQAVMSQLGDINASIANGFANAEISRCNTQANLTNQLNTIAMNQQNSHCENRQAIADLKYTISQEASATRANDQANTQLILDKLCQQEIDALKAENANLRTQASLSAFRESQNSQTAVLEQRLNPTPIPAYVVGNPNGCGCGNYSGCCAA